MRHPFELAQLERYVDFFGFIYYPGSKRVVEFAPHSSRAKRVGVFVNANEFEIRNTVHRDNLDFVQLHGQESVGLCRQLKMQAGVIKAFGIHDAFDFASLHAFEGSVDYFLFDTFCSGYGGSGRSFTWKLLEQYKGSTPFFLSGGLSPMLLPELLRFHHPRCVGLDLNSGFELVPGRKNIPLLLHFIENYHAAHILSSTR